MNRQKWLYLSLLIGVLIVACDINGESSESSYSLSLHSNDNSEISSLSPITSNDSYIDSESSSFQSSYSSDESYSSQQSSSIEAQQFIVTFVTNTDQTLDPVITSYIETMPIIEKAGYALEGWYYESNFVNPVIFPLFVDRDMTIYANWITASDGFVFKPTLDGLGYIVESYLGNDVSVAIQSTYNGKAVTEIGEYLFYNNESLLSVSLPSQLVRIGMAAFKNVTQLTAINMPDTLKYLDTDAFSGATSLSSINFSSSLEIIGNNAFDFCTSLASVNLPASIKEIRSRAFGSCSSLVSVTINATTPPLRFANSFEGTPQSLQYFVPSSALNTYHTNQFWSAYASKIFVI
jgi:uncharacterized repeat protein (TIGR02543 family)